MTNDDIQLLYEYDRWANRRALQQTELLTPEQFTRNLGFSSVRDILLHILSGEWIWLAYWKQPVHDEALSSELRARCNTIFTAETFPDLAALRAKWAEVEKEMSEFVNGTTSDSLEQLLPVRKTHLKLVDTMQHLANHSTYHRGQLALMMRQLGAEPLPTDFHMFLAEKRLSQAEQRTGGAAL